MAWIETLNPRSIELGLDRVNAVLDSMNLRHPRFGVITVGGTNGKGSVVAMLAAILRAAGYRTGAYTSPHMLEYNERICIDGRPVNDAQLCTSFARIEAARGATPLTYFEFGTVAAIDLFSKEGIDIAVLEVGMGGRLDAVNALDADAAIVTRVGIDHTDWLGSDRESIGREKAGIFRRGRPAICCDPDTPASVARTAASVGARYLQLGRDFQAEPGDGGWVWRHGHQARAGLPYPAMRGDHQLLNAAGALMALETLADRYPVSQANIRDGLLEAVIPGRFQTLPGPPLRVLDVAHNTQAAGILAATLAQQPVAGRTLAVAGMLRDKPLAEVMGIMAPVVDRWYAATLHVPRGAEAVQILAALHTAGVTTPVQTYDDVIAAYSAACADAGRQDRIVVFGSFYTVSDIIRVARRPEIPANDGERSRKQF